MQSGPPSRQTESASLEKESWSSFLGGFYGGLFGINHFCRTNFLKGRTFLILRSFWKKWILPTQTLPKHWQKNWILRIMESQVPGGNWRSKEPCKKTESTPFFLGGEVHFLDWRAVFIRHIILVHLNVLMLGQKRRNTCFPSPRWSKWWLSTQAINIKSPFV